MAPGRVHRSAQPPRASQQRVIQQRAQQVRRALQDQQRSMQQRRVVQQRRSVQPQRAQQRSMELQRQLETLRQQQQRLRVWQRTAAKRAARQIETEQAIMEREERLRTYGRDRESYQSYVRRRHGEARAATAAAAERTAALDSILAAAVAAPLEVGFEALKREPAAEPFDPRGLQVPLPAPRADQFQPGGPPLPNWFPGQRAARERARDAAAAAYRQAVADHKAAEFDRVRRLSLAKVEHQRRGAAAAELARAHNAAVDRLRVAYCAGERRAVEKYARIVLSRRSWPEGVQLTWRLRYWPNLHQLDAECELPGPEVVPHVRRYRYVAAVDAIRRQFIPVDEVRRRYAGAIAQTALCVLFDLFHALDPEVVDVIQVNGRASIINPGAGRSARPHLVSVAATRAEWTALRRAGEEPQALLRKLDARFSADPYAGMAVQPWALFDATD